MPATRCSSSSTTWTSIKRADWVIDMGPEAGDAGGMVVVQGTPEDIAETGGSHTGRYLQPLLHTAPAVLAG